MQGACRNLFLAVFFVEILIHNYVRAFPQNSTEFHRFVLTKEATWFLKDVLISRDTVNYKIIYVTSCVRGCRALTRN